MRYHACFFVFYLPFCRVMLEDDSTGASTQGVSRLHLSIPRPPCYVLDVNEHRDISAKWIQVICFLCLTRRREKRSRDVGWMSECNNKALSLPRLHIGNRISRFLFEWNYIDEEGGSYEVERMRSSTSDTTPSWGRDIAVQCEWIRL